MHTGQRAVASRNRLLTTAALGPAGEPAYALEGSVFIAGAAIQWLRDEMRMIGTAAESEKLARSSRDRSQPYLVPAFVGLGAPYWDAGARGAIVGITRGTSRADVVRAALDSIAYQVRDALAAMEKDSGHRVRELRVDGGATANGYLMQFQADVLGRPVRRPKMVETTALGAAMLAGLAAGLVAIARRAGCAGRQRAAVPPVDASRRAGTAGQRMACGGGTRAQLALWRLRRGREARSKNRSPGCDGNAIVRNRWHRNRQDKRSDRSELVAARRVGLPRALRGGRRCAESRLCRRSAHQCACARAARAGRTGRTRAPAGRAVRGRAQAPAWRRSAGLRRVRGRPPDCGGGGRGNDALVGGRDVASGLLSLPTLVRAVGWGGVRRAIQAGRYARRAIIRRGRISISTSSASNRHSRGGIAESPFSIICASLVETRSDLDGVYLETATEANVAYYTRHGYEVIGEFYPLGVRMWRMFQSRRDR